MADVNEAAISVHRTLSPGVVDRITFADNYGRVEVLNRDGADEVYFTVDVAADPTVGGDGTNVLPAAQGALVVNSPGPNGTVVRLISTSAVAYSVRGV